MADDLVSMKRTDDEKSLDIYPFDMAPPSKPDFPYGLKICLTEDEFKKLADLDPNDAKVGHYFTFTARARITDVSHRERVKGEDPGADKGMQHRVEAQIEEMSIDSEDSDEEKD